ncbi:MAG: nitroreductase family protein [Rikenellaceae bacterium]
MEFKEIISKRRSVRKFSDKVVPREVIDRIIESTLKAPSSRNSRSSNFLVVTQKETLAKIATMRDYGSAFVKDAAAMILVMGDTTATDLWEVNASISATTMQLAIVDEGLASCWVHVKDRPQLQAEPNGKMAIELLREILPIKEEQDVLCGIALGYSDFEPKPLPEFDHESKIVYL